MRGHFAELFLGLALQRFLDFVDAGDGRADAAHFALVLAADDFLENPLDHGNGKRLRGAAAPGGMPYTDRQPGASRANAHPQPTAIPGTSGQGMKGPESGPGSVGMNSGSSAGAATRRRFLKGSVMICGVLAMQWPVCAPAQGGKGAVADGGGTAAAAGGVSLFNGRDLDGWEGAPGWWTVEDGALTAESTAAKPCRKCNYLVWKGGQPEDFELSCEFRLSAAANSGVQIRSETRPDWDTYGYQADMTGDGKLVGYVYHHKRGLIGARGEDVTITADGRKEARQAGDPAELLKAFRKGEWNRYRITCRGPEITLHVNDVLMCRITDNDASTAGRSGIIALQMHPGPPMKVQFRNIVLKEPR